MTQTELEARELLRLVLPFMDEGHECGYCGKPHGKAHEKGCAIPRIEKLVGRKLLQNDERTARCEHGPKDICDYCLIAFGQKHGVKLTC